MNEYLTFLSSAEEKISWSYEAMRLWSADLYTDSKGSHLATRLPLSSRCNDTVLKNLHIKPHQDKGEAAKKWGDLSVYTFLISFPLPDFSLDGEKNVNAQKKQNMKRSCFLEINLFLFIYCFSILKTRRKSCRNLENAGDENVWVFLFGSITLILADLHK